MKFISYFIIISIVFSILFGFLDDNLKEIKADIILLIMIAPFIIVIIVLGKKYKDNFPE